MPNDIQKISMSLDDVYDTLRYRIMTLELPPGTKLNRRDLEMEFGVSQTPIRDAMKRLSDEHLIDVYRQSKTMVSRINLEELYTVFLMRNAVVTHDLADRLAHGVSPTDFESALHYVKLQELGLQSNEGVVTFIEQQNMFAKSLYTITDLLNVYHVLTDQAVPFMRYRILDAQIRWRREQILELNFEILDGIKNRDRDKIGHSLQRQLECVMESQTELQEKFPDYFI